MKSLRVGNVEVDGLEELYKKIERLLTSNEKLKSKVNKIIKLAVIQAREEVRAKTRADIPNDPRKTYTAVKKAVYRKIFGGNVNILNMRSSSGGANYEPPRTLRPGQRGGNRVPRGAATKRHLSYKGYERGYVLRFLNSGTTDRTAGSRGGVLHGNRGSISGRNFFSSAANQAIDKAAQTIADEIDAMIAKEFNE